MTYRVNHDALDELIRISEALGLYDEFRATDDEMDKIGMIALEMEADGVGSDFTRALAAMSRFHRKAFVLMFRWDAATDDATRVQVLLDLITVLLDYRKNLS